MGMRPTFNVQHKLAEDPLVDKKIGNAYKTVEYVADNMSKLLSLTPRSTEERFIEGTLGLRGETVEIKFPLDISIDQVRSSLVQIRSRQSQIFSEQSGVFTAFVDNLGLTITLKADAPLNLQNSTIMWSIVYGVTNG